MCPPAFDASADMVFNGSDEQAFMYLERLRRNCRLPDHVIDLNPHQYMPCNLPGKMWYWYLVCSTENRTELGFWRQKEAACKIFTDSDISCWRTTWEFIETQDAREKITDWVMQEYKITEKGQCSDKIEKESRVICSVFLSDSKNSNLEVHPNTREAVALHRNGIHSVASIVPGIDTVNNAVDSGLQLVCEADRHLAPQIRNIVDHHYIADDDYLELDDLVDPLSRSTSSDNSSGSSFTLVSHLDLDEHHYIADDDYLELDDLADPLSRFTSSDNSSRSSLTFGHHETLLPESESDNKQSQQAKSNSSFIVTASAEPCEVLMQPATLGSVVCASERQPPAGCTLPSLTLETKDTDERVPDHTVKPGEQEKKGDPSCSVGVASSSNSGAIVSTGERKAAGVKIKGLKKLFFGMCFMP